MKNSISKFFGFPTNGTEGANSFSGFFTKTGSAGKKKIIRSAIKKANEDQRQLVAKYDREYRRV